MQAAIKKEHLHGKRAPQDVSGSVDEVAGAVANQSF